MPTSSPSFSGRPAPRTSSQSEVRLQAGPLSLGVVPGLGASISHFRWNGLPVLRDAPVAALAERDGRAFSAFPLIPFSNRIRAGTFRFGGAGYLLGRDAEDPRHALHGTSRFYPWEVAAQDAARLRCTIEITPQNLDWPFAFAAWQDFALSEDGLRVTLGLRNTGAAPAPFGLGLHPYFVRVPDTVLRFDAAYVWVKDDEDIPVHAVPDAGRFNFSTRHELDAGLIDNDYGGFGGRLEIAAPGRPLLSLRASPVFDHLVLFTPVGKPYFAAEPVTHRPDAINPNGDEHDQGMTVLAPGGVMEGEILISVGA